MGTAKESGSEWPIIFPPKARCPPLPEFPVPLIFVRVKQVTQTMKGKDANICLEIVDLLKDCDDHGTFFRVLNGK